MKAGVGLSTEGRHEGDSDVFVNFCRQREIDQVNTSGGVVRVPDGQARQEGSLGVPGCVGHWVDGQDGGAAVLRPLGGRFVPALTPLLLVHVVVVES